MITELFRRSPGGSPSWVALQDRKKIYAWFNQDVCTGRCTSRAVGQALLILLSGGQSPERATANLQAMQHHTTPWPLTFSFGRALVDPALAAWHGDPALVEAGQAERVAANAAAVRLRAQLQPA